MSSLHNINALRGDMNAQDTTAVAYIHMQLIYSLLAQHDLGDLLVVCYPQQKLQSDWCSYSLQHKDFPPTPHTQAMYTAAAMYIATCEFNY